MLRSPNGAQMALAQTGIKSFARANVNKAHGAAYFFKNKNVIRVDGHRFLGIISRHVASLELLGRLKVRALTYTEYVKMN
jgi:hypothetical protein